MSVAIPPFLRRHWPALVLAALAAAVAAWARYRIYPGLSFNRDEAVYLWQVETLDQGFLKSTDGGRPGLFLPWLSGARDGSLFTQYTLGWPLVLLAAKVLTGSVASALYAGASLAVIGTYALAWEVTQRRATAILAATCMVASPIVAIQGGIYLSYLFTLGLGLLFGVGLLSGIRTGRPGRVVIAGALLGWIFFTRPYDGLLWGITFGLYAIIATRHQWRQLVRPFLLVAIGATPLVLATMAYNLSTTGAPLAFPITAVDPLDTFGFGLRRMMPGSGSTQYSLPAGLYALAKHAFFFPWFLLGSYLGIGVAAAGLWRARHRQTTLLIVMMGLMFPLGYLPFWGTWVSGQFTRVSGPIYYLPLYTSIVVLIAIALVEWYPRHHAGVSALGVALVLATLPPAISRLHVNNHLSTPQQAWLRSVEAIDGPAIVFVGDTKGHLLFLNPFSANGPQLNDRILYAVDQRPDMLDLIADEPNRRPYLQWASASQEDLGPKEKPVSFDVVLEPVTVARGATLNLQVTAGDPHGESVVAIEVRVDGQSIRRHAPAGTPLPPLTIGPPGGTADLILPPRGVLVITLGYGATEEAALTAPRAQHRMVFRRVGSEVEVLVPANRFVYEKLLDRSEWRHRLITPDLAVAITPAG